MSNINMIAANDLKSIFPYSYALVDLKTQTFLHIERKNTITNENLNISDFVDLFIKSEKIEPTEKPIIEVFLTNLNTYSSPFANNISVKNLQGEEIQIEFRGKITSDNDTKLLLAYRSLIQPDELETLDPLTKVYQRPYLINYVHDLIKSHQNFLYMMIDIDNFKGVNDSKGHMFGDLVLYQVGQAIKRIVEPTGGIVARIGGDEFIAIYKSSVDYSTNWNCCREVRSEVAKINELPSFDGFNVSITLGSTAYPKDGRDYNTLYLKADKALYRGKMKGRNCFVIYTPERCGDIKEQTTIKYENSDGVVEKLANNTNTITGVFDILYSENPSSDDVYKVLDLLGKYYIVDRIAIAIKKNNQVSLYKEWLGPQALDHGNQIIVDEKYYNIFKDCYDQNGVYRQVDVFDTAVMTSAKKILADEATNATIIFALEYQNERIGHIRFDMCHHSRMWQKDDEFVLLLVSKLLAIVLHNLLK